ncbi:MAG: type II secretion system ATPase GspE [Chromatiales bacterium]|jgi:general secretion pathway protein E
MQQYSDSTEASQLLPYHFAKRQGVVLADAENGQGTIYFREAASYLALLEVNRICGTSFKFEQVDEVAFNRILNRCYQGGPGQSHEAADSLQNDVDLESMVEHLPEPDDLLEDADEAPVIRLINALITEAIRENASDIHIEPAEGVVSIRFRIDGVLRNVIQPKKALAPLLVSRIKIMAKLDIAEKRVPQDGRVSLRIGVHSIDIRVSTLPGAQGERIVLRILDKQNTILQLQQLGMPVQQMQILNGLITQSHGIVLVTGPTGSGKTTSLYAMINQLDKQQKNIITVEDPVEYQLEGISQTQVNPKVDLTFARGLRAILRQDPDVIMVGEIRDRETAEIAVQASLTGHLVFSTLHTNTAIGAVTRLRDMGVESYLLASSLVGVISQRLVRNLCPHCKKPYTANPSELAQLTGTESIGTGLQLYRAVGCDVCNHIGYKGRTGIYEVIAIDKQARQLIHDDSGEQKLEQYVRQFSDSIQKSAAKLVLDGVISVEEALRVTRDNLA